MRDICLDTSAYSHFLRGSPSAAHAVRSAGRVIVPVIVIGELHAGFRGGTQRSRNEAGLQEFLAHPAVSIATVDIRVADHHADILDVVRRAGTAVPTNDPWIAAIAVANGLTIVSCDRNFERIPGVSLVLVNRAGPPTP